MSARDSLKKEIKELRARLDALEKALGDSQRGTTLVESIIKDDRARYDRLEALAQKAEDTYRELLDANDDALCLHEASTGKILHVNSNTARLFGRPTKSFRGITIGLYSRGVPPFTDRDALYNIQKAARDGRAKIHEWICKDPKGEEFSVSVNLKSLLVNSRACVVALVRSLPDGNAKVLSSEELVAEQEELRYLASMNRRLQLLSDGLPHVLWIADPSGSVIFWNDRFFELTGLKHSESLDTEWYRLIHPDDLAAYRREWIRSVATGDTFELEFRMTRDKRRRTSKQQVYLWYKARAVAARDEKGEITEWFGTFTEIEHRHR